MLYMIVCVCSFLFYDFILCQKWRNKTVQSFISYLHGQRGKCIPLYHDVNDEECPCHFTLCRSPVCWSTQNGRHFSDDILKLIFLHEICCILNKLSLTFMHRFPINSKPALVKIKDWSRNRWRAIIWTNDGLVHWRILGSIGLDGLTSIHVNYLSPYPWNSRNWRPVILALIAFGVIFREHLSKSR